MWTCFLCVVLSEGAVFALCLAAAYRLDGGETLYLSDDQKIFWALLCAGTAFLIVRIGGSGGDAEEWKKLLLGVAAGGQLFACLMDRRCCKVYDFVWWIVLAAGFLLLCPEPGRWSGVWGQFVCFLLLQRCLFDRFYGRADVYAFCSCGLLECGFGMGLLGYLLHMAGAFLLLAIVQISRHNIGTDGNLKRSVPFLPYIVFSFWGTLLSVGLLQ